MSDSKRTPVEEYDSKHGDPSKAPEQVKMSDEEAWGTSLNPVRNDSLPAKNLREVGSK